MTGALGQLLKAALRNLGSPLDLTWDRILVLNSIGSLCDRGSLGELGVVDHGFHLLLLSREGRPAYYCKCRRTLPDRVQRREVRFLRMFGAHPQTRSMVPRQGQASDGHLEVLVTEFIGAPRMDHALQALESEELLEVTLRVLDGAYLLTRVALDELPQDSMVGLDLSTEAEPLLSDLGGLELTGETVLTVRRALAAAGTVPEAPQHRDLWPRNVFLYPDGGFRIIDFDGFGEARVPLHDTFHLLRTVEEMSAAPSAGPWSPSLLRGEAFGREAIRRARTRFDLSARQVGGCLLYYLVDIAVATYRRGGPEEYWGRFRDEIPAIAHVIDEGQGVETIGELVS